MPRWSTGAASEQQSQQWEGADRLEPGYAALRRVQPLEPLEYSESPSRVAPSRSLTGSSNGTRGSQPRRARRGSARRSAEERHRRNGTRVSRRQVSKRVDIQETHQNLFEDDSGVLGHASVNKTTRGFHDNLEWGDRDGFTDKKLEMLKRKMRGCKGRMGEGYGWRELFDEYDRSGDGSLDMAEFRRALRMEMQITRREISDSEIEKIYEALDVDGNGDISCDEFIHFVSWSPNKKWRNPSERQMRRQRKLEQDQDGVNTNGGYVPMHTSSTVAGSTASRASTASIRTEAGRQPNGDEGPPFVSEYIALQRAVLREGHGMHSRRVGFLEKGEIVAVLKVAGNRMFCQRLRAGDLPCGWASEYLKDGAGEPVLENLEYAEWSDPVSNDLAIATRVAMNRSLNRLGRKKGQRHTASKSVVAPKLSRSMLSSQDSRGRPLKIDHNNNNARWWDGSSTAAERAAANEATGSQWTGSSSSSRSNRSTSVTAPTSGSEPTPRGAHVAHYLSRCTTASEMSRVLDLIQNMPRDKWVASLDSASQESSCVDAPRLASVLARGQHRGQHAQNPEMAWAQSAAIYG